MPAKPVCCNRTMENQPTPTQLMEAIVDLKDGMVSSFEAVHRRLDEHDRRFDSVDRRLGRIETRVEDLERRLPA